MKTDGWSWASLWFSFQELSIAAWSALCQKVEPIGCPAFQPFLIHGFSSVPFVRGSIIILPLSASPGQSVLKITAHCGTAGVGPGPDVRG